MKRKRYRYIFTGGVSENDKISDYRLVYGNVKLEHYEGKTALKVNIPDDLKLEKYSCDLYSTTEDNRTIKELGYVKVKFINRKFEVIK